MVEQLHIMGRSTVHEIREWLEGTDRFEFPVTVFDDPSKCSVTCLNGESKTFDLFGYIIEAPSAAVTGSRRPVSLECKKYSAAGGQATEFRRFLAVAYSSTARAILQHKRDEEREFMWVTFHPFSLSNWVKTLFSSIPARVRGRAR